MRPSIPKPTWTPSAGEIFGLASSLSARLISINAESAPAAAPISVPISIVFVFQFFSLIFVCPYGDDGDGDCDLKSSLLVFQVIKNANPLG
jgi:hypothetical protein